MAFTGTATVEKITDSLVRFTGLSLGVSEVGTIGLFGDAGADENLPDDFNPSAYGDVSLIDSIQCSVEQDGSGSPLATPAFTIGKSHLPGTSPFRITITNLVATATGSLEIYVRFH
jgi:hypothetical protein